MQKILKNSVRIIGGKWRSRKIDFPSIEGLRPSPDRVRETLFNWLSTYVVHARCLDLFAGSGALGFEALSRGAKEVVFVDSNKKSIEQIQKTQTLLNCQNMEIYWSNASQFLAKEHRPFDIIFLDPPFHQALIIPHLQLIIKNNLLTENGLAYLEAEIEFSEQQIPHAFEIVKHKTAGKVRYLLLQKS